VVLQPWSPKKTAEKLRREADRAEHHLEALRERRRVKEPAR
jgi:hypothetical protein